MQALAARLTYPRVESSLGVQWETRLVGYQADPRAWYEGAVFSARAEEMMRKGKILRGEATAATVVSDLLLRLERSERDLGEDCRDTEGTLARLYDYLRRGLCILGPPLLTNIAAGRPTLGSCIAVPIDAGSLTSAGLSLAGAHYQLNMGSGYDLTSANDPVAVLRALNEHSARVEASGSCERYVGNMAHLSVGHPRVAEFVSAKTGPNDIVHFNTSVDVTAAYMHALDRGEPYSRLDGSTRSAREVWDQIVGAAWACGDPGIISLERFNEANPLQTVSPYVTTAPCAEVGLAPGESCVFGYVNLAACLSMDTLDLDLDLLGNVAECLTRILDDALETSVSGFPTAISRRV